MSRLLEIAAALRSGKPPIPVMRDAASLIEDMYLSSQDALPPPTSTFSPPARLVSPACWCTACDVAANGGARSRMSVCPQFGNKRCPRAAQHDNACTGSNEPGQPGSSYPAPASNEVDNPCPQCGSAAFPGYVRGVRCDLCDGRGTKPGPSAEWSDVNRRWLAALLQKYGPSEAVDFDAQAWAVVHAAIDAVVGRAPNAAPSEQVHVLDDQARSALNGALCDLAARWKIDGDWMTCKACKRSLIASRVNEALPHAAGCKLAATTETHPWQALLKILRPLYLHAPATLPAAAHEAMRLAETALEELVLRAEHPSEAVGGLAALDALRAQISGGR